MGKTLTAVFDGKVLVPDDPAEFEENRRYEIALSEGTPDDENLSAWDVLDRMSGTVDMPEGWALDRDRYIHGTPKPYAQTGP
jgi:hypothetical protein